VRIKGVVIAGFEEFAIKGSDCKQIVNAIWLAYPEGDKRKGGPCRIPAIATWQEQLCSNQHCQSRSGSTRQE
jgi:hypothetical protein